MMKNLTHKAFSAQREEWPTLALVVVIYTMYWLVTDNATTLGSVPTVLLLSLTIAWHSSLQHEVLHGHPFRNTSFNSLLVFPPIGLFIPYGRFRDTHLQHHQDANLTDPYDDPETAYLDQLHWNRLPAVTQRLLLFNNTLFGRMLIGPAVGLAYFYQTDFRLIRGGNWAVLNSYLSHLAGLILLVSWLYYFTSITAATYIVASYGGFSLLKIRTYLEHKAHAEVPARTAIVNDRGPLGWLFLFNNYHSLHHLHPRMPWYKLPATFDKHKDSLLARNHHYYFESYLDVFKRYLFARKEEVAHPFWTLANRTSKIITSPERNYTEHEDKAVSTLPEDKKSCDQSGESRQ